MSTYAPIVLFVYNRPAHTRATVEALLQNPLASECDLFIYSDGPKDASVAAAVGEVRKYITSITGFKSVTITERDRNYGLADSIVDGVTTVINQYGRVIVLEDDIVTSPNFLSYMNEALTLYETDENVMHISGYFFPVDSSNLPETFFYNQTSCWGWGTWARAWQNYNPDAALLLQQITDSGRLTSFDMDGQFRFSSTLRSNASGKQKTWAIKWHASVFLLRGLCLHPKHSLTLNIGNDGSGQHSSTTSAYGKQLTERGTISVARIPLEESTVARELAKRFLASTRPSLFTRIKHRLLL